MPVLHLLETSNIQSDFYGSYVLLMWLSIIVYMPFNMMGFDERVKTSMDDNSTDMSEKEPVVSRYFYYSKISHF